VVCNISSHAYTHTRRAKTHTPHTQVREQLISDLQARIEEDFERWQTAVNTAVENRKSDDDRFQVSPLLAD